MQLSKLQGRDSSRGSTLFAHLFAPLCSIAGFTPQGQPGFPPAAPEPLSPPAPAGSHQPRLS